MILVDVYIPSLDRTYDFQMEESATIESLVLEMAEMIAGQTENVNKIQTDQFLLCQCDKGRILERSETLQTYGIKNGTRLMLV